MIIKMFSIFDAKTNVFSRPFYSLTTGEATRTFTDAVSDNNSMMNRHPEDYFLYEIGQYDDSNSELVSIPPQALGSASEYTQEPDLFNPGPKSVEA